MALENNKIDNFNKNNDEISLKEFLIKIQEWNKFLISKWKLILIMSAIGSLIGLKIAFDSKTKYKAYLTFAMEEAGSSGGGLSGALGLASSFGIDLGSGGGGAFASTNLTEFMKSRLIVEKVLLKPIDFGNKKISLAEYYIQKNKLRDIWNNKPELKDIQFSPGLERTKFNFLQDSLLQIIYNNLISIDALSIQQKDKKVAILTIEVTNEDERFAKFFCENIAKETSDFYVEIKSKKARMNVDILQKQADSIRNELGGAIIGVASEIDKIYNLNPSFNILSTPSKRRQVDVQANQAVLSQIVVQLELAKIALRKETPLIQQIDKPILPLSKIKISKLKSLIIGGLLAGFLTIIFLFIKKVFSQIMA